MLYFLSFYSKDAACMVQMNISLKPHTELSENGFFVVTSLMWYIYNSCNFIHLRTKMLIIKRPKYFDNNHKRASKRHLLKY